MRIVIVFLFSLLLTGCFESVRQSIGISSKPFSKKQGISESTKMNYKITWGKIRKEDLDD